MQRVSPFLRSDYLFSTPAASTACAGTVPPLSPQVDARAEDLAYLFEGARERYRIDSLCIRWDWTTTPPTPRYSWAPTPLEQPVYIDPRVAHFSEISNMQSAAMSQHICYSAFPSPADIAEYDAQGHMQTRWIGLGGGNLYSLLAHIDRGAVHRVEGDSAYFLPDLPANLRDVNLAGVNALCARHDAMGRFPCYCASEDDFGFRTLIDGENPGTGLPWPWDEDSRRGMWQGEYDTANGWHDCVAALHDGVFGWANAWCANVAGTLDPQSTAAERVHRCVVYGIYERTNYNGEYDDSGFYGGYEKWGFFWPLSFGTYLEAGGTQLRLRFVDSTGLWSDGERACAYIADRLGVKTAGRDGQALTSDQKFRLVFSPYVMIWNDPFRT